MILRGGSRGNAGQLARYLLKKGENEHIRILDVNGRRNASEKHVHDTLRSIGLTEKLTRSKKPVYHVIINPAKGEDQRMTDDQWLEAADITAKQLKLDGQQRVIVLHTKNGRTHAHIALERYDHEKGKMRPDSFSRLAQDRARKEMELHFGHAQTPHRNPRRPEMRASLSDLWKQSISGVHFINAARENGYIITHGAGRQAFGVVDAYGRSYNLVRQLEGVKTAEVRQRLQGLTLANEKATIGQIRTEQGLLRTQENERIEKARQSNTKKQKELFERNKNAINGNRERERIELKKQFDANSNSIDARKVAIKDRLQNGGQQKKKEMGRGMEYD